MANLTKTFDSATIENGFVIILYTTSYMADDEPYKELVVSEDEMCEFIVENGLNELAGSGYYNYNDGWLPAYDYAEPAEVLADRLSEVAKSYLHASRLPE